MREAGGLQYQVHGQGEPVLLIHGSHVADAFLPMAREPVLSERFRLLRYHRRGFAESARHAGPFSIEEQAQDALSLAGQLGLGRFHVVGHSYGAVTAVQLAIDAPQSVRSLVLLEPPLMTADEAAANSAIFSPLVERYASGDARGAVDLFMGIVGGADWRADLARTLPGAAEQAEKDAATFFEVEVPALQAWSFDADKAKRISQPVLFLLGSESGPLFERPKDLFASLVPQTQVVVLQGLDHMLQVRDPALVARTIAGFLARHPL
jgi:pimeloyl-ACP methyl ester carboxylesterase